jgi:hypothetical protein
MSEKKLFVALVILCATLVITWCNVNSSTFELFELNLFRVVYLVVLVAYAVNHITSHAKR